MSLNDAGSQRVAMRQGGVFTYLHGDHLGSASLATDVSGAKVSEQRYLPYGGTRSGSMPTDRQYTGQRREASLGFYDYVARQFDPALGIFLQADTIIPDPANPQSLNRYSYTLGNPLRYTDPSGHFSEEEIKAYLEGLGYNEDEIAAIVAKWMADIPWWNIIGKGEYGARIGDWLSGTTLDRDGMPGDWEVLLSFFKDGDTFNIVISAKKNSVTSLMSIFGKSDLDITSLVDFYDLTADTIWMRDGEYMGGCGYGANRGILDWGAFWEATRNNAEAWFLFGAGLLGASKGSPEGTVGGLLGALNVWENDVRPPGVAFYRSWNAHTRFTRNELTVNKAME